MPVRELGNQSTNTAGKYKWPWVPWRKKQSTGDSERLPGGAQARWVGSLWGSGPAAGAEAWPYEERGPRMSGGDSAGRWQVGKNSWEAVSKGLAGEMWGSPGAAPHCPSMSLRWEPLWRQRGLCWWQRCHYSGLLSKFSGVCWLCFGSYKWIALGNTQELKDEFEPKNWIEVCIVFANP